MHLGVVTASLLNIYNPGLVILGDPLAAAGDLFLETVRATARKPALPIMLE
jgi:predicted NBD/HSP70 family sugar kinase